MLNFQCPVLPQLSNAMKREVDDFGVLVEETEVQLQSLKDAIRVGTACKYFVKVETVSHLCTRWHLSLLNARTLKACMQHRLALLPRHCAEGRCPHPERVFCGGSRCVAFQRRAGVCRGVFKGPVDRR